MKSSANQVIRTLCLVFAVGFVAGSYKSTNADFTVGVTTNVGPNVNSSYNDGTPCISRDGLSLYFASTRPGGVGFHDLWVATRASTVDEWSKPVHLGGAVNSGAQDYGPSISGDELTLYFRSIRVGGLGQGDIWVSTRASKDAPWPDAVNAGSGINTSSDECMPFISADGLELYFGSTRPGGSGADDIYVVTRPTTGSDWSDPVNLGSAVNSGAVDACPSISPDGLTLFFNSTRDGGFGNYDLYVTTRPNKEAPWSTAVNLGESINTADDEMTPSFWADGSVIYFCSWAEGRPGALGGADLWRASLIPIVDFSGDGVVDLADFSNLAQYWGHDESSVDIGPTPLGDGLVDVRDLAALTEYWLVEFGLVAHWKLDETEGIIAHDSAGDHDGVLMTENPLWRPLGGQVDGAVQLDGVDDYVSTPFVLNPANHPISVFVWVKGGGPAEAIISQTDGTGYGSTWLGTDPSKGQLMTTLMFFLIPVESQSVVIDGDWHDVGVVWDGSRRHLYVDGAEVAKDTIDFSSGISCDGDLYFGAAKDLDASSFWSGLIDDIRIYNRAIAP